MIEHPFLKELKMRRIILNVPGTCHRRHNSLSPEVSYGPTPGNASSPFRPLYDAGPPRGGALQDSSRTPINSFRRLLNCMVVVVSVTSAILAQDAPVKPGQASPPAVTATASAERVRFTAPDDGVELRLEVYSETGELVSDSGFDAGNVMDWKWRAALPQSWFQNLDYLCVVT